MAGEVILFMDFFDVASTRSARLEKILGAKVLVQWLADSKNFFDVISKGSQISGKKRC